MPSTRHRQLAATTGMVALLACLATSVPARAEETVIFRDRVPSTAELAHLLWPGAATAAPAGVRTRGLVRARSIRLDEAPVAPSPMVAPPPAEMQQAASEPTPAAAPAAPASSVGFGFDVRFAFDSTEVLPESRPYLDQVGALLQSEQAQGRKIAILGHTDATGSDAYNAGLSQRRALAVARYLAGRYGVAPERLQVAGLGERAPLAGLDPADAANRRVEFHAVE